MLKPKRKVDQARGMACFSMMLDMLSHDSDHVQVTREVKSKIESWRPPKMNGRIIHIDFKTDVDEVRNVQITHVPLPCKAQRVKVQDRTEDFQIRLEIAHGDWDS